MLKATLIGNLGSDPDLRYSANSSPFLRFNVASSYRARTPEGEYQDRTEWVRVSVTGARAESLSQYLKRAAGSTSKAASKLARGPTSRVRSVRVSKCWRAMSSS
jgi:single stranded DNA-binding protein